MEEQDEYDQNNNLIQINQNNNINNEQINIDLMKRIEVIDNENVQLKDALTELQEDLKEKDSSIEESHKIISKLQDEYSKLVKEYQNLENINKELIQETKYSKTAMDNYARKNNNLNKLQKQNEELNTEIIKQKNENYDLKNKIQNIIGNNNKNETEIKNKTLIINDLNGRLNKLVEMIKDREKIINEQSKKINELNGIIDKKDEEMKILVNFSKEINKGNKQNMKEITKQAINTIKAFNHNRNNSYDNINSGNNRGQNTLLLIKDDKSGFSDFIPMLKKNKTSFALKDAINSLLFIPKNIDNNIISKEFLMNMNFKTELLKSELFASLLRETKIVNFLKDILNKLNIKDDKVFKDNNNNVKNVFNMISKMRNIIDNLMNENKNLKRINMTLKDNQRINNLFTEKVKNEVKKNMRKIRDKINALYPGRTNERYNRSYTKYDNNNNYKNNNIGRNGYKNNYNNNHNDRPNYRNLENEVKYLQEDKNKFKNNKKDLKNLKNDYIYNDNINFKNNINSNEPKYNYNNYISLDIKKNKSNYDDLIDNNKNNKSYNNNDYNNNNSINKDIYNFDYGNSSYIKVNDFNKSSNFNRRNMLENKNINKFYSPSNIDDKYISNFNNKYHKKKNSSINNDNLSATYQYNGKPHYFSSSQKKIISNKY